jgi:hypothetical protein
LRLLDVAGTENVKYRLACREQIIGDYSPFGIRIPPILATRELTSSVIWHQMRPAAISTRQT